MQSVYSVIYKIIKLYNIYEYNHVSVIYEITPFYNKQKYNLKNM